MVNRTELPIGLLQCPFCLGKERYTPRGLDAHLTVTHGRRICVFCGCDKDVHREVFGTGHDCQGSEGK